MRRAILLGDLSVKFESCSVAASFCCKHNDEDELIYWPIELGLDFLKTGELRVFKRFKLEGGSIWKWMLEVKDEASDTDTDAPVRDAE